MRARGVDEAPLQAGFLDVARQFEVFHHFVAHGFMAADRVVGRSAKEQKLADRDGEKRGAHALGQRDRNEGHERPGQDGHQQLLAPRFHFLVRHAAEEIGVGGDGGRDRVAQHQRIVAGVGIGEEQILASWPLATTAGRPSSCPASRRVRVDRE